MTVLLIFVMVADAIIIIVNIGIIIDPHKTRLIFQRLNGFLYRLFGLPNPYRNDGNNKGSNGDKH